MAGPGRRAVRRAPGGRLPGPTAGPCRCRRGPSCGGGAVSAPEPRPRRPVGPGPRARAARTVSGPAVAVVVARGPVCSPTGRPKRRPRPAAGPWWWANGAPGRRPALRSGSPTCQVGRHRAGTASRGPCQAALWPRPWPEGAGMVVLPASADGRDLAPRLAATTGAPATGPGRTGSPTTPGRRPWGGGHQGRRNRQHRRRRPDHGRRGPSRRPGAGDRHRGRARRGHPAPRAAAPPPTPTAPATLPRPRPGPGRRPRPHSRRTSVAPDPGAGKKCSTPHPSGTMDLAEATRVLHSGEPRPGHPSGRRRRCPRGDLRPCWPPVAGALGASAGATRVVTDAGWMDHEPARSAPPAWPCRTPGSTWPSASRGRPSTWAAWAPPVTW